jgi:MATE family multidrug resistance protein
LCGYATGVGNHISILLGAGDPETAKLAARVNIALVLTIGSITALALLLARNHWGSLFSASKEAQVMIADLLFYVASYIVLEASEYLLCYHDIVVSDLNFSFFQLVGTGALCCLRSAGVVKLPAITNVAAFYIVGIPLGAWLTFGSPQWGIYGLWAGLAAGMFLMVVALTVSGPLYS